MMLSTLPVLGRYLSHGNLVPAFRGTEEGQSVLALAISQVTLIRNTQYAKVAYVGMACPESHQRYCSFLLTFSH